MLMSNLEMVLPKVIKSLKKPLYMSIEAAIVGILAFIFGYQTSFLIHGKLSFWGGIWCMTNALGILYAFVDSVLVWAKIRIVANLFACFCALTIPLIFGSNYFTMFLVVLVSILISNLLGYEKNSRICACVVTFIIGFKIICPEESLPVIILLRLTETLFGIFLALFAVGISYKFRVRLYTKATKKKLPKNQNPKKN